MYWLTFFIGFLVGFLFFYSIWIFGTNWEENHNYIIDFDVVRNEYVLIDRDSWDITGGQIVFQDKDYIKVEEYIHYLKEKKKGMPKKFKK